MKGPRKVVKDLSRRRSPDNWSVHDKVIAKIKAWKEGQERYAVTNPGQEKNVEGSVKRGDQTVYPDVVVRPKKGEPIDELYEVETPDSIDEEETGQWKKYNAGKSSFYLVVPEGYVSVAKNLIRDFTIAGFYCYNANLEIHPA